MHPRAAFREYYRQFRNGKRLSQGKAFVRTHMIVVRNRYGFPRSAMMIYFMQDDDGRDYIMLDRALRDDC
jgi:hypothetical protein